MDFCAWMEVYLAGRWWTFDPRNNEPRIGRVLVGRGRDALDVAMITTYGSPSLMKMTVWADEVLPTPTFNDEAGTAEAPAPLLGGGSQRRRRKNPVTSKIRIPPSTCSTLREMTW